MVLQHFIECKRSTFVLFGPFLKTNCFNLILKGLGKSWPNGRESDSWSKGCEFESRAGRNCRWGEWMSSALSTFNTTTEVPLSKALNPQLVPERHSINGCPMPRVCVHCCVCVCVHLRWVKCRAQIPRVTILGCHFCFHFTFPKYLLIVSKTNPVRFVLLQTFLPQMDSLILGVERFKERNHNLHTRFGSRAQWEDLCVRSSEAHKPAPQNALKY